MKKNYFNLLAVFILFSSFLFAQQPVQSAHTKLSIFKAKKGKTTASTIQAKTAATFAAGRSVNYYWDNFGSSWMYSDSSLYAYNTSGFLAEELSRNGIPNQRKQYTYDSKGRETLLVGQYWDNSTNQWKDNNRYITVYDSQDNQIEYRYESFDSFLSQWDINYGSKNIIVYNSSNHIISNTSQNWDSGINSWIDTYKYTNYLYNSNGMPTQIDYQSKNGLLWENDSRELYTYSIANVLVEAESRNWNGSAFEKSFKYSNVTWNNWTGDFETSTISSYTISEWGTPVANQWNVTGRNNSTYDAFGGSVSTDQVYINSVWVNDYRYSSFFDSNSNETGYRNESWQTLTSSWTIDYDSKMIHTYDVSNNITQTIWQYWDSNISGLVNSQKKVYSDFKSIVGIKNESAINSVSILVYPNPVQSSFTVRIENVNELSSRVLSFKIYDILGKEVMQKNIDGTESLINKGNLSTGIYFYTVLDKSNVMANGKLVVD